jgi:RES domain-containing protein
MKPYDELLHVLETLPGKPVKKPYYRLIGIKYLKNPLSALGSKLIGGRYNYIGTFEVLYVAPDAQTAVREIIKDFQFRFPPKSLITIEVDLRYIADLEDRRTIETLGIDRDELFSPWRKIQDIDRKKAYTQTLGEAIYNSKRFEGIRYPSAKVRGKYNLAIFPDRLKEKSRIKVYDPDKLLEQVIMASREI